MLSGLERRFFVGLLLVSSLKTGFASPAGSRLLSLVIPDAEIVSGVGDMQSRNPRARVLLSTLGTGLDLDDLLALAGVDPNRQFDEIVEVAASSPGRELGEHMVIAEGRFDQLRIFGAAKRNGAQVASYAGDYLLIVKPFEREKARMHSVRLLIILDNRTAILGTPWIALRTLRRHAAKAPPDPVWSGRIARLKPDVNSWSIVANSTVARRHIRAKLVRTHWAQMIMGANELTLGIHYSKRARIDFVVGTGDKEIAASLASSLIKDKTQLFDTAARVPSQLMDVSTRESWIEGSFLVPEEQVKSFLDEVSLGEAP